jgi:Zn-dependent protease with chaperone function
MSLSAAGRTGWLTVLAVLAIALAIGFYLLSVAMAVLLFLLPFAIPFVAFAAVLCWPCAGAILWAIVPRRIKWVDPGPELLRKAHPRLFAVIDEVAAATGQKTPDHVYADLRVNATVLERRRFLFFGSRRILVLGLPMVASFDEMELRAVMANGFGRFRGGALSLNQFICRTRRAIEATLGRLRVRKKLVRVLFEPYALLYLRLTRAIGRQQERLADALAAEIIGAEAFAAALRKLFAVDAAMAMFWNCEYAPALHSGFHLPFTTGLRSYLLDPRVRRSMDAAVTEELTAPRRDPYGTHPPLADRLRRLEKGSAKTSDFTAPSSVELLGDLDAVEIELLLHVFGLGRVRELQPLAWENAVDVLTLPRWRKAVSMGTLALGGRAVRDLPDLVRPLGADPFRGPADVDRGRAWMLGAALGMALHRAGWRVRASGATTMLISSVATIDPFVEVADLAAGSISAEAWGKRVEALGIASLPLDDRPRPAAPADPSAVLESATLQGQEPA